MDPAELGLLEDELRRDLEALARVRRLMEAKSSSIRIDAAPAITLTSAVIDDEQLDAPATSLKGKIEEVINADSSTKWTTQKVLTHLERIGFPLKAQKPIYSIGQALNKLVDGGRVRLARKGTGSTPNIYKARATEPTDHSPLGHEPQRSDIQ